MGEILCVAFVCGLLFFNIKIYKTIYNPATIFTMLWAIILLLYSLHLYGLYYANIDNLIILVIGIVFFNVGCLLSNVVNVKSVSNLRQYVVNEKVVLVYVVFSVVVLLFGAKYNISNLSRTVQVLRYGGEMNISYSYVVLRDFFAVPIIFAVLCIFFANIILQKKFKKYLVYVIVLIILDILALFEQLCVYAFVACVCFTLLVYLDERRKNTDQWFVNAMKKYSKLLIVLLIVLVFVLCMFRTSSLLKRIYNYVANSVVLYSIQMDEFKNIDRNSFEGMYTYGITSTQGLLRHLMAVLENFGYSSELFDSASYVFATYFAYPKYVAPGSLYNSFVTMFMYFYKDLGLGGVILFSGIYGYVVFSAYKNYRRKRDVYSLSIYIFFVISIFFTYIQSPFIDKKYAFSLILLMLLKKRDKDYESSSRNCDLPPK